MFSRTARGVPVYPIVYSFNKAAGGVTIRSRVRERARYGGEDVEVGFAFP